MSSSSLPEAGAKLTLDLSEWNSSWDTVIGDAEVLQSTIDDLSGTVDIDFNVDDAILPFDDIPESTETDINVTEDEETKGILDGLNFLVALEKIKIAISIVGNVLSFVQDISSFAINPFLDIEDAVAKINAQTGGTGIADLGQLIRDIQAADLGDSVGQISDVMIAAQHLNQPLEEAATAALTFTHTFKEEDPTTVLNTLDALVKQSLVPDLQAAADLMTVFFQAGGNKSGDALSTVDKYATAWADMGLEISEAMSFVTSLMAGGVDTSEAASKMLLDFDNALTTAATDPTSAQAKFLAAHGLDNPKEMGEAIGAETIDGFVSAFQNMSVEDQDAASKMFFGKGGALNTGAIAGATSEDSRFKDYTDAAKRAATEVDNSLRGVIDDFVLAFNTKIAELLSSESIDLPGKIADLKEGLQKALDVVASGGTIGEGIEVGLNIPGFADGIDRFQASVGNFAISVLEIVAGIQEFLGKDSSGTRGQITALEKNQLPFNLQIANPDEIAGELQTAIDRGLTTSDIAKATNTAFNELIAGGDIDKAQALVDGLNKIASTGGPMLASGLNGLQISLAEAALRDGDLARIQEQIDAGNLIAPVSVDTTVMQQSIADAVEAAKPPVQTDGWWQNLKPPSDFLETALSSKDVGGKTSGNGWWTNFQPTAEKTGDATTAFDDLQTHAETSMSAVSTAVTTANDESVASLEGLSLQAQLTDTDIATAMTGNTVTASFEAVALAAQTSFPAVIEWFNRTSQASAVLDAQVSGHIGHLLGLLHDLQFLSAQVATGVQAALTLGAGMGGGGNTTTNNVTVNNNVNGPANAAANGYAIARELRGTG